jgi:hypothetical protein
VTITNGALTSVNLTATPFSQSFGFLVLGTSVFVNNVNSVLSNLSQDGQSWSLSLVQTLGFGGASLAFTDTNGVLTGDVAHECCGLFGGTTGSLQQFNQVGGPVIDAWIANYYGLSGTVVATPLPAALPLFATGLGALGLLGWRRKRKTV